MEESIIMLVVVVVLIIVIAISFLVSKKKNGNKGAQANSNSGKKAGDGVARKDMSEFIKFDKIANDMIYQKKGEKYTMAIECKGINYDLMSEIEQMAVEEGFIKFLNTLKTPIQLYVQTRSVNLSDNIRKYKERTAMFDATYSDMIAKYNEAEDDIDVSKEDTERLRIEKIKYGNIAEYANDITKYIERMSLNKFMLQRKYYILISYYKSEIASTEKFSKEEYEELCYRELYTRAQGIIASLTSCSIKGRILTSNELAELIYISYNRDDQRTMDVKRALESGFYRLYTTSPDVREKRQQMLDEEIKRAAAERVELAIQEGLKNGTLISEEEAEEKMDKRIDKEAIDMINSSDISSGTKEKVKDIIIDNRKKRIKAKNANKPEEKKEEKDETVNVLRNTKEEEKTDEIKERQENEELPKENKITSNTILDSVDSFRDEEIISKKEPKIEEKEEVQQVEKNENKNEELQDEPIITNNALENEVKKEERIPSMNDEIDARENMGLNNISTEDETLNKQENETDKKQTGTADDSLEDDSIV